MNNGKNWTDGENIHVGGAIEFDGGAKITGAAVNVAASTASSYTGNKTTLNELLVALKDAGIMVGDEWDVDVKDHTTVTWANMPTEETIANSGHATAEIDGTDITITLDCEVSDLDDADHGDRWGVHKWFAIGVKTGLSSVVGVKYTDTAGTQTLSAGDDSEASTVGLSAGDFVLYFKAEKVLAHGARFTLAGNGFAPTEFTVTLVETAED